MLTLRDIHKTFNRGTANEKVALQGVDLVVNEKDFVTVSVVTEPENRLC